MRWIIAFLLLAPPSWGASIDRRTTNTLSPGDYLMGSHGKRVDPIFDVDRRAEIDVDIGIGTDCGRINVRDTMRAALKNILDSRYLRGIGEDIVAASPTLLVCYMSPTWCAILKSARVRANFLAQLRFDQCGAINKFMDQRVADYYEERSSCVQKEIKRHNGNFEKAMSRCRNYESVNIKDWSGANATSPVNSLIGSTAKWAGFTDKSSKRIVDLSKAFLGDTIVKKGSISVDWGPRRVQLTPRTYLREIKASKYKALCEDLLSDLSGSKNVYQRVSGEDLRQLSDGSPHTLDHQTIRSLVLMPYRKRMIACRKLSDALAFQTYTEDMGQTLDFVSGKLGNNPHLPTRRKEEADRKRRAFKDQVELTLAFEKLQTDPLNEVLFQINKEGGKYGEQATREGIASDNRSRKSRHINSILMDCGDGVTCDW